MAVGGGGAGGGGAGQPPQGCNARKSRLSLHISQVAQFFDILLGMMLTSGGIHEARLVTTVSFRLVCLLFSWGLSWGISGMGFAQGLKYIGQMGVCGALLVAVVAHWLANH